MLDAADRIAITDLVHRYAAHVDSRDPVAAAALFAEDAELVVPRPPESMTPVDAFQGRVRIEQALQRVLHLDATVHEIAGHVVDADPGSPDRALGRTACVAHHLVRGKDDQWHIHYADEYVRTPAGWRFARRAYTVDSMRVVEVRHPRP